MKKSFKLTLVGIVLSLASCGGAGGGVDEYISQAEQQTPVVANKYLGDLPGLKLQEETALSLLKEKYKEDCKDLTADESGIKKFNKLSTENDAKEAEIKAYYDKKDFEAIETVIGKEIPATFAPEIFQSVKCIVGREDSTHLCLNATLVLNKDFPERFASVSWNYLDETGAKIVGGTQYLEKGVQYVKGTTVNIKMLPKNEGLGKLASIYFYE